VRFRYVLDTDVVVAALRSDQGASRQLLLAALNKEFDLMLSVPLILEYEAVLTRPEHLAVVRISKAEVTGVLDDLAALAQPVKIAFRWRPSLPDPDDDMVLETAVQVTSKTFDCAVLLPREALRQIRSIHEKE
jgi:predicted nucleic acid-binding protein